MTNRVTIPASIDDAIGKLEGIESLLTAKGWERAAIVYAFTRDARGDHWSEKRGEIEDEKSSSIPVTDFADLGIAGLRTRDTVRRYRNAWIAGGGDPDIKPGDDVDLPEGDFPPEERQPRIEVSPGSSPDTAVQAIKTMNLAQRTAALKALVADEAIAGERKAEAVATVMSDDYAAREVVRAINSDVELRKRLDRVDRDSHPTKKHDNALDIDDWQNWTADEQERFDKATIRAAEQLALAFTLRSRGYQASPEAALRMDLIRPASDLDAELADLIKTSEEARP